MPLDPESVATGQSSLGQLGLQQMVPSEMAAGD